jgi:hypothetical protein
MDPHDNPYTPGAGVKPPALVGRDAEVEAYSVALTRLGRGQASRSFVLDGLRGVGKTVLLNEFDALAREKGWISSGVVEVNEADSLGPLVARVAHRALRKLSLSKKAGHQVRRALGVLKAFTFTQTDTGGWQFKIDVDAVSGVADSGDPEADIVELLVEIGAAATENGAGVVFLLDELQFLSRDDLALLAAAMHRVSQEAMPVLLVGAGLPQLPLMLKDAKPYTERLFDYKTIGSLGDQSARAALTIPASRRNVTYDDDALTLILEQAGGYPFFLQQWGETVWSEAEGDSITLSDARLAEDIVNDELDRRFFRDRYEKATDAEKIYMSAMADLGTAAHPSADIAAHMKRTPQQVSVSRAGLLKKGLIYNPVDTDLAFTVPQFAQYIRRIHPFDPNEKPARGRPRKP